MSGPPVSAALLRAEGYFELGMHADAEAEIAALPAEERGRAEVIAFRISCLFALKRWAEAAVLVRGRTEANPENATWWIQYAYATRRAESVEAAEKILLSGLKQHPEEAMIWFNLSCYACVTGRLDDARDRLAQAYGLDKACLELARTDEDLRPIWPELRRPRAGT